MFILHAVKRQISMLFIEIILSQDGRTSFEGRTLQDDELLLEDMVSGWKNFAGVCRDTSPYLCKSDGYVRVHAVCNWQCILCALERHFHILVSAMYSVSGWQGFIGWQDFLDGRLLWRPGLCWNTQWAVHLFIWVRIMTVSYTHLTLPTTRSV